MKNDETITRHKSPLAWWGKRECEERSFAALERYPAFFEDPAHQAKIEATIAIVSSFLKVNNGVYTNYRFGTSKSGPFTTIKVASPKFPNVSTKTKNEQFIDPLDAMGVERVFTTNNSYLFHVR